MDNILIRKLKIEDEGAIRNITLSISNLPAGIDFKKIVEDESTKSQESSFVAEVDGKVVGFMISNILNAVFGIEKSSWITMFGVHPKYMDKGIGKRLAEEIFKFCKENGIHNIYTSVRWDSTDLLSYFKTLGFDRSNFINLCKTLK